MHGNTHHKPRTSLQIVALIVALALSLAASAIHLFFFPGEWYVTLDLPVWAPADWVYQLGWVILYLILAISIWVVWRHHGFFMNHRQIGFYLASLILSLLWPFVFFTLHFPGLALTNMLVLWATFLATMVFFSKRSRRASRLLLPCFLWIVYIGFVNAAIWAGFLFN